MIKAGRALLTLSLVLALTAMILRIMGRTWWCKGGSLVPWSWELFENTPMIIERYREATISLDYFGDTILNSLSDILACAAGFGLAACLPAWSSVLLFALVESVMLITIRDSLIINVIMLIAPLDAIKSWQMSGGQTP